MQTPNCSANYLINTTFDTGTHQGWSVGGNDTTQLVSGAGGSTYALGLAPDDDEPRPPEQPAIAATTRDVALTAGQLYCISADVRADGLDQPITIAIGPVTTPAQAATVCSGGTATFQRCAASYRAATTTTYRITVQQQRGGTLTSGMPRLAAPLAARTRTPTAAFDTFTLAPALEPAAPLNLRILDQDGANVSIAWDAVTTNPPVVRYVVYLNGSQLGTTTNLDGQVLYLSWNSIHTITVRGQDAGGNLSQPSNTVSVTMKGGGTAPQSETAIFAPTIYKTYMPFVRGGSGVLMMPSTAISYYVKEPNTQQALNLGTQAGIRDRSLPGIQQSLVILVFGQPLAEPNTPNPTFNNDRTYGTGLVEGEFASFQEIAAYAKEFARGYYVGATGDVGSTLRLVLGPNNFGETGRYIKAGYGVLWADQVVDEVATYLRVSEVGQQVSVAGGGDFELTYNSFNRTKTLLDGYASATDVIFYNFGNAAGCSTSTATDEGTVEGICSPGRLEWQGDSNTLPVNDWTQAHVWYLSASPFKAREAIPQIYNIGGVNAQQWNMISLHGLNHQTSRVNFAGVLSQAGACAQRPNASGCAGANNGPQEAYRQLYDTLSEGVKQRPTYSTDIRYP